MIRSKEPSHHRVHVAGYVRVSSQRQATQGDSLEAQRRAIASFIEQKKLCGEWENAELELFVEPGRSGKNERRPAYQRLRDAVMAGNVDAVVCTKFDRVSRNVIDLLQFRNFLQEHGVELASIREQLDTSTPHGKFALNMLASVAEMERDLISERTTTVMADRACRGMWNIRPPYGYNRDDETKKLVINEVFAPIIREHFFDAVERLGSVGAVTRHLREIGIVVPRRETKRGKMCGGKPFNSRQVAGVLRNKAYIGIVKWADVTTPDAHEPAISHEQFERVQRILDRNCVARCNPDANGEHVYVAKQLVRCGRCGSAMTPSSAYGRNGKHFYYACSRRCHEGQVECDAPSISAPALDEALIARCVALSADELGRDRIVADAIKQANAEGRRIDGEIETVRRRQAEVGRETKNLIGVLRSLGNEGLDSVRDELTDLEEEKTRLAEQMNRLIKQRDSLADIGDLERQFLESWRGLGDLLKVATPEEQQRLLRNIIEVVDWTPSTDSKKRGTYAIRFFPEAVRELADFLVETWPDGPVNDDDPAGAGSLLSPVRELGWEAPRVGLEPTTK